MTRKNPFGEEPMEQKRANPFGAEEEALTPAEAVSRMEQAARRIRSLRSQIGAEGLSAPASRELIDEVATGLEAAAKALRAVG